MASWHPLLAFLAAASVAAADLNVRESKSECKLVFLQIIIIFPPMAVTSPADHQCNDPGWTFAPDGNFCFR